MKVCEVKAISVGEHLAEGCPLKGTARLVGIDPSTVRRLHRRLGEHGEAFHDQRAQQIQPEALEADERHGYATDKGAAAHRTQEGIPDWSSVKLLYWALQTSSETSVPEYAQKNKD